MGRDLYVGGLGYFKFLKIWSMLKDMIEKITFFCLPYWVIPSTKAGWGDRTKDKRKGLKTLWKIKVSLSQRYSSTVVRSQWIKD